MYIICCPCPIRKLCLYHVTVCLHKAHHVKQWMYYDLTVNHKKFLPSTRRINLGGHAFCSKNKVKNYMGYIFVGTCTMYIVYVLDVLN